MSRINEPLNTKLQWSLNTLEMQKTNCEKDANRCWRWNSHFSVWNGKQNQKCTQQPINWNRRWERANRMLTEAREIPKINPQWFWMHSKRDKWKKNPPKSGKQNSENLLRINGIAHIEIDSIAVEINLSLKCYTFWCVFCAQNGINIVAIETVAMQTRRRMGGRESTSEK